MIGELLRKAFDEAATLPENEQEELALLILEDVLDRRSKRQSDEPVPSLREMLEEARREHREGKTQELDPDAL